MRQIRARPSAEEVKRILVIMAYTIIPLVVNLSLSVLTLLIKYSQNDFLP